MERNLAGIGLIWQTTEPSGVPISETFTLRATDIDIRVTKKKKDGRQSGTVEKTTSQQVISWMLRLHIIQ